MAWSVLTVEGVEADVRPEGHTWRDEGRALSTPLLRKDINPFGRDHFDLARLRAWARAGANA